MPGQETENKAPQEDGFTAGSRRPRGMMAGSEPAIDARAWAACKSEGQKPEGKTAFGVRFATDEAILAEAVMPKEGPARISLLAIEPLGRGLSWLAEYLNSRHKTACCVVVSGTSWADVLLDKLRPVWVFRSSVIKPDTAQRAAAANLLSREIGAGALAWGAEQIALDESARTATKRQIGGGWLFDGQTCGAIEACSLALWGCKTSKRNPKQVMRIG